MNINDEKNRLEKEQSILRIIGLFVWAIYLLILVEYDLVQNVYEIIKVTTLYLVFAIGLSFSVDFDLLTSEVRRYGGMLADVILTTIIIHLANNYGVPLFAVYLWITIGNGFRYGNRYLIASSLCSLLAFMILSLLNSYWLIAEELVFTGLLILIVVPAYIYVLLNRLRSEKVRAERASQEKSRFIANVSHEIRTPLNAIVGLGSMIDKVGADERRDMLMRIKEASGTLMGLVEGVLDLSRIESGDVNVRQELFDLPRLIDSVEGIFRLQAKKKGVQLGSTVDRALPRAVVGDQQRLRQVLINLVGNAIKFTEKGYVELRVTCAQDEAKNEVICFEVIDTGPGMTSEFQSHIFERFRQENDSIVRRYGGTGLGTSISQNLVELMGGKIGVQSVYGQGSRFWFTHPLVRESAMESNQHQQALDVFEQSKEHPSGINARVLVVEDCDINCYVYRAMFKYLGVKTDFAENGIIALGKLMEEKYDLVVFDMQIPGMSGTETIARYHQLVTRAQRPPIVVITGDATTSVERKCEQLGVQALLAKPVSIDKIRELVQRFVVIQDRECPVQS